MPRYHIVATAIDALGRQIQAFERHSDTPNLDRTLAELECILGCVRVVFDVAIGHEHPDVEHSH